MVETAIKPSVLKIIAHKTLEMKALTGSNVYNIMITLEPKMNDMAKQEGRWVETYDYGNDFQLLTPKEKRGILKNAQTLLKLQKENDVLPAPLPQKRNEQGTQHLRLLKKMAH